MPRSKLHILLKGLLLIVAFEIVRTLISSEGDENSVRVLRSNSSNKKERESDFTSVLSTNNKFKKRDVAEESMDTQQSDPGLSLRIFSQLPTEKKSIMNSSKQVRCR